MKAKIVRRGDGFSIDLSTDDIARFGLSEGQIVEIVPKADAEHRAPAMNRTSDGQPFYTLDEMIAEMDRLGPSHRPEVVDWGPDVGAEIIRDDY